MVKRTIDKRNSLWRQIAGIVLIFNVHQTAIGRLEGNRTERALVEDLAMLLLYVLLVDMGGHVEHFTVKTPCRKNRPNQ